jgi:hypothetical protein
MIRIVRGNPTPEELAATLAVVRARAALAAPAERESTADTAQWSDPARIARATRPVPGPRAWARTYWPV